MCDCLGCCLGCFYACCCCQFNFAIFPAPPPSYSIKQSSINFFTNDKDETIPYLELMSSQAEINMIYFHGNAEDIGYSSSFLLPIQQKINANIFALEYPCYGAYERSFGARISDDIKKNAIQFYRELKKLHGLTKQNTIIMGRSIGSGGACYLANREKIQNLILISPFTTIPSVAQDFVGCLGCLVKEHFNNLEEIRNYNGGLLVIHGRVDEVIAFKHGKQLVSQYQQENKKCTFIAPRNMSHNFFDFEADIIKPIKKFVNKPQ